MALPKRLAARRLRLTGGDFQCGSSTWKRVLVRRQDDSGVEEASLIAASEGS